MEDIDPVVREIDVFVSPQMAQNLFVLQHPLRPQWRPYEMEKMENVKMKPLQRKLELSIPLDVKGRNYDPTSEHSLKEQTLCSAVVPPKASYAVGVLNENQLHLVPVHATLQLRPSLHHIDVKDERERQTIKQEDDNTVEETAVNLQYRRNAGPEKKKRIPAAIREETWMDLAVVPKEKFQQSLYARTTTSIAVPSVAKDYFTQLIPAAQQPDIKVYEPQLSLTNLRKMPLEQQVQVLLLNGHVMKFERICQLCSAATHRDQVLRILHNYGVLVKGLWVAKSKLIYDDSPRKELFRDFLLLQFRKPDVQFVNRKDFNHILPPTDIHEVLQGIAILKPAQGWQIKEVEDRDFIAAFPDIVAEYEKQWDLAGPKIIDAIERPAPSKHTHAVSSTTASSRPIVPVSQHPSTSQPQYPSGPDPQSTPVFPGSTPKDQLQAFILYMIKQHGVVSQPFLLRELRAKYKDTREGNLLKSQDVEAHIPEILSAVAGTLHNTYFIKQLGTEADKYRTVILKLFSGKKGLKKAEITEECLRVLGAEIPGRVYTVIMKELAVSAKGNIWQWKIGNGQDN